MSLECAILLYDDRVITSLTPPLVIEVPVPSQENKQPCICMLGVSIVPLSTILIFDIGIVPTVWYFCFSFDHKKSLKIPKGR